MIVNQCRWCGASAASRARYCRPTHRAAAWDAETAYAARLTRRGLASSFDEALATARALDADAVALIRQAASTA